MKSFLDWLDHRSGIRALVHEALYERIPGGSRWRYVWGSTLVFTFTVQAITGIFLWMCYSASTQTAWESVYYVQYQMQGGWFLRGLHHFTAQAMVVLLALHLLQVVIDGAYRAPREVNFWLGLILMQIVLGLSLTGYLLPWDQKGYWATRVATNLLGVVPAVGPQLQSLVVGGSDYGHHTLTRFFALHAGVLPGLLVGFLVLHVALFRRHGITAKQPYTKPDATFWPDQVLKDAVACLAVMIVVLAFVLKPWHSIPNRGAIDVTHLGADLGAPADPSNQYSAARPEWYFLFLFQFLKLFEGQGERGELLGAVVIPGAVMLLLFLMPLIGRWQLGHRFNVALLLILLVGVALLTAAAINEDYQARWTDDTTFAAMRGTFEELGSDQAKIDAHFAGDKGKIEQYKTQRIAYENYRKSQGYLQAVESAEHDAKRIILLAGGPDRIPPTGAISLLRADAKTQGPRLFASHCASCHTYQGPPWTFASESEEDTHEEEPDMAAFEKASAPNLYHFASRAWIAGLLDPKRVATPEYFGNTVHKEGSMADFVINTLTEWTPEQIENVIIALSAEAELPSQKEMDAQDQPRIEAGKKLIADVERCAGCHKFHDAGELGGAPDLTGYGSKAWLTGMISNPDSEHYYLGTNDRMPAFVPEADGAAAMLSPQALNLLVDWLRGQWYQPAVEPVEESSGQD